MSVVYQYQEPGSPISQNDNFKKKLFILLGLLVGCGVIMALVLIFGASGNVKQNSQTLQTPEQKASDFVTAVSNDNEEKVLELSTFKTDLSEDEIIANGDPLEELRGYANLDTCKLVSSAGSTLQFECDRVKNNEDTTVYKRKFNLVLNNENKIIDITYEKN